MYTLPSGGGWGLKAKDTIKKIIKKKVLKMEERKIKRCMSDEVLTLS